MLKHFSRMIVAAAVLCGWVWGFGSAGAEDWPMLGRDGTRNGVSPERGAPTVWSVEAHEDGRLIRETRGVRWAAALGSSTFSSPVIASGLVWIGTHQPPTGEKNPNRSVGMLKCFRAADGKQVYEFLSPPLAAGRPHDESWHGLGSSPLIEGDRLWIATNRGEVHCLDIGPLIRGEGTPRELWKLDLIKTFEPFQRTTVMGPPRPCSIGASWKGRIFVTINNGVGEDYISVPKPDAPSLVCLNKTTGEVHWTDNSPGANILVTQFSSPTVTEIGGQVQVIVPQSDGWVRTFDPESGAKLWEFDINPKTSVYTLGGRSTRNSLLGNAVVYDGRVYIASGLDAERGEGVGRLVCIDPTKRGDVSSELAVDAKDQPLPRRRTQAVDPKAGEKAISNPNSALVWEFLSCGKKFEEVMHRSMSSVAVANGLVIAADMAGLVHCFDAKTGQRHWAHDTLATIWSSPLIVDDKVYVSDDDSKITIYRLTAEPHEPLAVIPMDSSVCTSPAFANGTLYVASQHMLFAITGDKEAQSRLPAVGGHWPQWRGPNRDNVSTEEGLLKEWPMVGPPLEWRVSGLGEGISPVSIAGGRVFALCNYDGTEYVRALHERTGEPLWTAVLGAAMRQSPLMRWLTQRPVTVDGERLYAMSLLGELVCLRTSDGHELWRKNYLRDFSGAHGVFGYSDCPIVDGDKLLCSPGGAKSAIVALDTKTGNVVWTCAVPDAGKAAYGNGIVVTIDDQRQFVASLEKALVGVATDNGKLLWRLDGAVQVFSHPHTPLIQDRFLTIVNGFGVGLKRLELQRDNGAFAAKEVSSTNATNSIAQFQDDTLVVCDRLYEPSNGILSCFDAKTGDLVWRNRMGPTATMTFADGRFYFHSDGLMRLVEATATEPIVKSEFALPSPQKSLGTTTPIVTGGRLYVREDDQLFCYDILAKSPKQPSREPHQVVLPAPEAKLATALPERTLRSVFVPTPQDIVEKMLEMTGTKKTDVVFDLGSGDGRIVITSAKKYGCKAVGYELDKDLVEQSRTKADAAGVKPLVTFENKDLFTADLSDVDVLAVFLLPQQLEKLLPQIEKMKPGSRIVSHQFAIPGVRWDNMVKVPSPEDSNEHTIYLWTMPLRKTPVSTED